MLATEESQSRVLTMEETNKAINSEANFELLDMSPSERLRHLTFGVRVVRNSIRSSSAMDEDVKTIAANAIGGSTQGFSASKKLYNSKLDAVKNMNGVMSEVSGYWHRQTVPYVEKGIRLLPRDKAVEFMEWIERYRVIEIPGAATKLWENMELILEDAKKRLGDKLFNRADYPASLDECVGAYNVRADFLSLSPPKYLAKIAPEIYRAQLDRVKQAYNETVELAQDVFVENLQRCIAHVAERLDGVNNEGKPKVFRDSAIGNVMEQLEYFNNLGSLMGSEERISELVAEAKERLQAVAGSREFRADIVAKEFRSSQTLRESVAASFREIEGKLGALMVNRPKRVISAEVADSDNI